MNSKIFLENLKKDNKIKTIWILIDDDNRDKLNELYNRDKNLYNYSLKIDSFYKLNNELNNIIKDIQTDIINKIK